MFARHVNVFLVLILTISLPACQTAYYNTMEKFGIEKRDILVDRVAQARDAQEGAKKQFESALDEFIAVTNYQGGELEEQYRKLKAEFEDSTEGAEEVRDRIDAVERVSEALFEEWESELERYSDAALRRASADQLKSTKASYGQLIRAMRRAEAKIEPVLRAFEDRVLFLKHNLNARAIASLKSNRAAVESDIKALVQDMNSSIAEADRFMKSMSTTGS